MRLLKTDIKGRLSQIDQKMNDIKTHINNLKSDTETFDENDHIILDSIEKSMTSQEGMVKVLKNKSED
jgi:hypothetical protein